MATAKKAATETAAVKTTKTAAVKAEDKKKSTSKATEKVDFYVEFGGKQIKSDAIITSAKKAYKADGGKDAIKTLKIYVNADQHAAYFVVNNGEAKKIDL